jgi:hypothetical protein
MPDDENDVDKLKGFIDITEISQLTQIEDAADGCNKPNYIKIVVNNSREYFLAASDVEEKSKWFRAIRKQMKRIAAEFQLLSRDLKDLPENVVYVGNLQKRSKLGQTEKAWFALTTRNLRFYKGMVSFLSVDSVRYICGVLIYWVVQLLAKTLSRTTEKVC